MENPNTWGELEKLLHETLMEHERSLAEHKCGLSLERKLADALRETFELKPRVPEEPVELPQYVDRICCPYKGDRLTDLRLQEELGGLWSYRRGSNDNTYFGPTTRVQLSRLLRDPKYACLEDLEEVAGGVTGWAVFQYSEDAESDQKLVERVQAFLGEGYKVTRLRDEDPEERERVHWAAERG